MKIICILVTIAGFITTANGQQPATLPTWYRPPPKTEFVAELVLKPNQSKSFKIASDKPIVIGFQNNLSGRLTAEDVQKYKGKYVMLNRTDGGPGVVGDLTGGATSFKPVAGAIALAVESTIPIEVRVVIYTMKE